LYDRRTFYCYEEIETLRKTFLRSNEVIEVNDLGAGSHITVSSRKKIRDIAKYSATSKKHAQLLFRIGNYSGSKKILECGTSLGLTTLYFSAVSNEAIVITLEGDPLLAVIAVKNFELLGRKNIRLIQGDFKEKLPDALDSLKQVDLVYLDGNHRKAATCYYFNCILPYTHNNSILVVGDIHWSQEMREAWDEIVSHSATTLTLDLFYVGIVFFRKELSKQAFILRF